MDTISMPLNVLTKHHLKQSDDSLPLTPISQCLDQPSPTGEHALPLKQMSNLNNNSNFTISGSGLTRSNSLHSSSSSVYSSSAEPTNNTTTKRQYKTTTSNSETSARSSIVSQSQESAKSIDSPLSVTSVSEDSHYSQKSAQNQKRRGEGLKQALSFLSLRKRDSSEKNPLKWLCGRSDASIRHSTSELRFEQHLKLEEEQSHEFERHDVHTQPLKTIPSDLGPVIVQRMERLEEKIDIFFSGLSSASRSTTNSTHLEPDDPILEETPQNPYPHPQRDPDIKNQLKVLTAEITHLTKSNKNLSSCIDALGSSGLIDLLEMLSCSLERLHAAVTSLRKEQIRRQQTINSNHHETQLESQLELIQRLGFLLGQREEQLKHERRLNQNYRRNIEGLGEMICALEEEWKRAMPVMAQSGHVQVEGVADCIGRLSRRNGLG